MIDRAADITGCIINGNEVKLPNRQEHQIYKLRSAWHEANQAEREIITRQMNGRLAQKRQVENA